MHDPIIQTLILHSLILRNHVLEYWLSNNILAVYYRVVQYRDSISSIIGKPNIQGSPSKSETIRNKRQRNLKNSFNIFFSKSLYYSGIQSFHCHQSVRLEVEVETEMKSFDYPLILIVSRIFSILIVLRELLVKEFVQGSITILFCR